MTILIYDYRELEERASKHLRAWKVWHITLYILAAIFGIMNYTFLFQTEEAVANHCVFYPRELAFHWVELPNITEANETLTTVIIDSTQQAIIENNGTVLTSSGNTEDETVAQNKTPVPEKAKTVKRETSNDHVILITDEKITVEVKNGTMIFENTTHRYVLNPMRTLFPKLSDPGCQFAEYMPLLSAAFAIVWTTLFVMCPNGGRTRGTGLQEPWRILTPAFIFAFVMVILTGYSFTSTNGGLQAFCVAFHNYTNTTTCAAVNRFIAMEDNSSWSVSERISATRAASAGVWASWACACALLLARCLAGADFVVRHTSVHLVKDPQQKVFPHLQRQKSPRRSKRSAQTSPSKRDAASIRSEPTVTTELVTASVEQEDCEDSQPTSLTMTPLKERRGEDLEMKRLHDLLSTDSRDRSAMYNVEFEK